MERSDVNWVVVAVSATAVSWIAIQLRRRMARRRARADRHRTWSALAEPFGFRVAIEGDDVRMRGDIDARPFVLDASNGLGYGLDSLVGMRVPIVATGATLSVTALEPDEFFGADRYGRVQPPTGDAEFDRRFRVRANDAGDEVPAERTAAHPEPLGSRQHRDAA